MKPWTKIFILLGAHCAFYATSAAEKVEQVGVLRWQEYITESDLAKEWGTQFQNEVPEEGKALALTMSKAKKDPVFGKVSWGDFLLRKVSSEESILKSMISSAESSETEVDTEPAKALLNTYTTQVAIVKEWFARSAKGAQKKIRDEAKAGDGFNFKGFRLGMSLLEYAMLRGYYLDEFVTPSSFGTLVNPALIPALDQKIDASFTDKGLSYFEFTEDEIRKIWNLGEVDNETFIAKFLESYAPIPVDLTVKKEKWGQHLLRKRRQPDPQRDIFVTVDPVWIRLENLEEGYLLTLNRVKLSISVKQVQKLEASTFD
jgi:hypothetical protein